MTDDELKELKLTRKKSLEALEDLKKQEPGGAYSVKVGVVRGLHHNDHLNVIYAYINRLEQRVSELEKIHENKCRK